MSGSCKLCGLVAIGLGFLCPAIAANCQPISGGTSALAAANLVEQRGNLEHLAVEGNKTFSAAEIRSALCWDFDLIMAAHPAALWDEFRAMLQRKIVAGYRNNGFPDVRVDIRPNESAGVLLAQIDEGPRYLAGDVQIIGGHTISTKTLTERLTRPYWSREALERGKDESGTNSAQASPAMSDPIWEVGKPAQFPAQPKMHAHPTKRSDLENEVAEALADQGYFSSNFSVAVVPEPRGNVARLVVTIRDEGPRAVVGEVETAGNTINSRQEIIDFLHLHAGDSIDTKRMTEWERRLLDSGRFYEANISPRDSNADEATVGKRGAVPLRIEVKETKKVPPLSARLRPEEEILLKTARWLNDIDHWQGDLVIRGGTAAEAATIVISPHRGVLATLRLKSSNAAADKPDYAFVATADEVGIFSAPRGRKVVAEHLRPAIKLVANLGTTIGEETAQPDVKASDKGTPALTGSQSSRLNFGLGLNRDESRQSTEPFALDMRMLPATFLNDAQRSDMTYKLRGQRLSIVDENQTTVIDATSGRVIESTAYSEPEGRKAKKSGGRQTICRFTFESGAIDRELRKLHEMARGYRNDYDPSRPCTSFCGLISEEEPLWKAWITALDDKKQANSLRLLRLLMNRHIATGLDDLWDRLDETSRGDFTLGNDCMETEIEPGSFTPQLIARLTILGFHAAFPPYSWPWTLGREAAMVFVGKGQQTAGELQRIYESPDSGPLCFLTASALLSMSNQPASRYFAARGLDKLSLDDFRKDCRLLTDDRWIVAKTIQRAATAFRTMPETEVKQLRKMLPEDQQKYFREAVRALRTDRRRPIKEALSDFFDACWKAGLQQQVKDLLETARRDPRSPLDVL